MTGTAAQARSASVDPCGRALLTYSRRHIDLQRVAGALCPDVPRPTA